MQREGARPAWQEQQRARGGCGGTRRTEECEGKREGEREKEEMTSEDQRSSVSGMEADSVRRARTRSMALFSARRRSFTLRKLWT